MLKLKMQTVQECRCWFSKSRSASSNMSSTSNIPTYIHSPACSFPTTSPTHIFVHPPSPPPLVLFLLYSEFALPVLSRHPLFFGEVQRSNDLGRSYGVSKP